MSVTRNEAEQIARNYLRTQEVASGSELVLLVEETLERNLSAIGRAEIFETVSLPMHLLWSRGWTVAFM